MRASDVRFKFPYLFKIKNNNNLSNISSVFISQCCTSLSPWEIPVLDILCQIAKMVWMFGDIF